MHLLFFKSTNILDSFFKGSLHATAFATGNNNNNYSSYNQYQGNQNNNENHPPSNKTFTDPHIRTFYEFTCWVAHVHRVSTFLVTFARCFLVIYCSSNIFYNFLSVNVGYTRGKCYTMGKFLWDGGKLPSFFILIEFYKRILDVIRRQYININKNRFS